ncbi:MAG: hypothetical protein JNK82_03445 [Myxococcaceae bacterium]|nr:hypothetical protein [Myxococcaceae bacterium]
MMFAFVTAFVVAQTPLRGPVVVSASQRTGSGVAAVSLALATQVKDLIERESGVKVGLEKGGDASACGGQLACLVAVATKLGPHAVVVVVDAGKAGKNLAVHLEALAADATEPLATADFLVPAKSWQEAANAAVTVFARNVADKLPLPRAPEPAATVDAPRAVELTPSTPPGPLPAVTAESSSTSGARVGAWVSTAGAVGGLAASGVFLMLGLQDKNVVSAAIVDGVSSVPEDELRARAARGNTWFTVSLVSVSVAVALAALAVVLFSQG